MLPAAMIFKEENWTMNKFLGEAVSTRPVGWEAGKDEWIWKMVNTTQLYFFLIRLYRKSELLCIIFTGALLISDNETSGKYL